MSNPNTIMRDETIPEGYDASEWMLAEKLAKADGFVSLWAPTKQYRNWFIRLARAILAERAAENERCAKIAIEATKAPAQHNSKDMWKQQIGERVASSIRSSHE